MEQELLAELDRLHRENNHKAILHRIGTLPQEIRETYDIQSRRARALGNLGEYAEALEVLEDYREQFELGLERGRNEEELLLALDRPEEVVRDLVKEDWKAKRYHRRSLRWAAPLAVGVWLLIELAKAFEFGFGGLRWLYCVRDENWKLVTFALAGKVTREARLLAELATFVFPEAVSKSNRQSPVKASIRKVPAPGPKKPS